MAYVPKDLLWNVTDADANAKAPRREILEERVVHYCTPQ
jgi:hypothetical protein